MHNFVAKNIKIFWFKKCNMDYEVCYDAIYKILLIIGYGLDLAQLFVKADRYGDTDGK